MPFARFSCVQPLVWACTVLAVLLLLPAGITALADDKEDEAYHADYIYGVPADPSDAAIIAIGGRLYDKWWPILEKDAPETTHPAWPSSNPRTGDVTWRCKSCHGWDYKGAAGKYGSGSYKTGIKGVTGMIGKDPAEIAAVIGNATHGFTDELISTDAKLRIATFISKGLVDMSQYIDDDGTVKGDVNNGKAIFQTVCASCHGYDGAALNWGDEKEPGYVGTEANANPWEVLHKIQNGHPGVQMVNLRAFPVQNSIDVLAYAKTLREK